MIKKYIRKVTRVGKRSLSIVIPAEIVKELKINKRKKFVLKRSSGRLDRLITMTDREVLNDTGKISHELAKEWLYVKQCDKKPRKKVAKKLKLLWQYNY